MPKFFRERIGKIKYTKYDLEYTFLKGKKDQGRNIDELQ